MGMSTWRKRRTLVNVKNHNTNSSFKTLYTAKPAAANGATRPFPYDSGLDVSRASDNTRAPLLTHNGRGCLVSIHGMIKFTEITAPNILFDTKPSHVGATLAIVPGLFTDFHPLILGFDAKRSILD